MLHYCAGLEPTTEAPPDLKDMHQNEDTFVTHEEPLLDFA